MIISGSFKPSGNGDEDDGELETLMVGWESGIGMGLILVGSTFEGFVVDWVAVATGTNT